MKKPITIILMLCLCLSAVACSSPPKSVNSSLPPSSTATSSEKETVSSGVDTSSETSSVPSSAQTIEVDKNLLTVEVTLPASMYEGKDIDTVVSDTNAEGTVKATANEDGSITLKMSKAEHDKMMKEYKATVSKQLDEFNADGHYTSIKDIKYNDDFTKITLIVDKAAYEKSLDGFSALGVAMIAGMYHTFNGTSDKNFNIEVSVKDEATGEVFAVKNYPDDFKSKE